MTRQELVCSLLKNNVNNRPILTTATVTAYSNMALIKYWGKQCTQLNTPLASSISIPMMEYKSTTTIELSRDTYEIYINNVPATPVTFKRIVEFLNLLIGAIPLRINTFNSMPMASGFASSASGFAALTLGLNKFFGWQLSLRDLSILARLGSGSASRSVYISGKPIIWYNNGHCFAEEIECEPLDIDILMLNISSEAKSVSSTQGMEITKSNSTSYNAFINHCESSLKPMVNAIKANDFTIIGQLAEENATFMHQACLDSTPVINYLIPKTLEAIELVKQLRHNNMVEVYYTIDAGPNPAILYKPKDKDIIRQFFRKYL